MLVEGLEERIVGFPWIRLASTVVRRIDGVSLGFAHNHTALFPKKTHLIDTSPPNRFSLTTTQSQSLPILTHGGVQSLLPDLEIPTQPLNRRNGRQETRPHIDVEIG